MYIEVFLSYAREDIDFAKQIIAEFEKNGIEVWWDNKITVDSENFSSEIEKAIEAAQCFFVLWSENSEQSDWVKEENNFAKRKNQKIIQVSVGDTEPPLGCGIAHCEKLTLEKGKISNSSLCGRARSHILAGEMPVPEGWPATG